MLFQPRSSWMSSSICSGGCRLFPGDAVNFLVTHTHGQSTILLKYQYYRRTIIATARPSPDVVYYFFYLPGMLCFFFQRQTLCRYVWGYLDIIWRYVDLEVLNAKCGVVHWMYESTTIQKVTKHVLELVENVCCLQAACTAPKS